MTTPKYRIVIEKDKKGSETSGISGLDTLWLAGGSTSGDEDETGDYNIPEFLRILWKLVNDQETNSEIHWSSDGKSFLIDTNSPSWKNLLAVHYKHSNIMSFIRQLNMYGFKKVSLRRDTFSANFSGLMCFSNSNFRRNHPQLLKKIKRQIKSKQIISPNTSTNENPNFNSEVLKKIESLSTENSSIFELLNKMKKENLALWRELSLLRRSHDKQREMMASLFNFLLSFIRPTPNGGDKNSFTPKRKRHLMIEDRKQRLRKAKLTKMAADACDNSEDDYGSEKNYFVNSASETSPQPSQFSSESGANTAVCGARDDDDHDDDGISQNDGCTRQSNSGSPINNDVILTPVRDSNEVEREIDEWLSSKTFEPATDADTIREGNISSTKTSENCLDSDKMLSLILASPRRVDESGSIASAQPSAITTTSSTAALVQKSDFDSLHEFLNQKKCDIDTNSILDMFNYTNALPVDYDFLSLINENDTFANTNEQQLIPYSGSSSSFENSNFFNDDLDELLEAYQITPTRDSVTKSESLPKTMNSSQENSENNGKNAPVHK